MHLTLVWLWPVGSHENHMRAYLVLKCIKHVWELKLRKSATNARYLALHARTHVTCIDSVRYTWEAGSGDTTVNCTLSQYTANFECVWVSPLATSALT